MKNLVISLLNFYQNFLSFDKGVLSFFAPGGACQYSPTCSEYTKQEIARQGVIKGVQKGLIRIWSCR